MDEALKTMDGTKNTELWATQSRVFGRLLTFKTGQVRRGFVKHVRVGEEGREWEVVNGIFLKENHQKLE